MCIIQKQVSYVSFVSKICVFSLFVGVKRTSKIQQKTYWKFDFNFGFNLGPLGDHFGTILGPPGAILGHLGAMFGPTWAHLGTILAHSGPSWAHLGPILGHLEPPGGHHGPILVHLGPSWPIVAPFWPHFGPILGPSWGRLGPILGSRDPLGAILAHIWAQETLAMPTDPSKSQLSQQILANPSKSQQIPGSPQHIPAHPSNTSCVRNSLH